MTVYRDCPEDERPQVVFIARANGGDAGDQTYNGFTPMICYTPTDAREGYTFLGWALFEGAGPGDVTYPAGERLELDDDLEVYAVWGVP